MQQDVHVILLESGNEVLRSDALTPITASTALKASGQPQRLVVVALLTTGATAVVTILVVEEAAASLGTLGEALAVDVGVHVDTISRALQKALVADGPADDVNSDVGEGEGIVAVDVFEPLLVLLIDHGGNLLARGFGDGLVRVPADTIIDFANEMLATNVSIKRR